MKTRISVQERLKDLRVERGLNLEELAQETGISKSALGSYENDNDEYKEINHGSLLKLADFYQVSVDYLLGLTNNRRYENTPIEELHLSDEVVELLKSERFNSRVGKAPAFQFFHLVPVLSLLFGGFTLHALRPLAVTFSRMSVTPKQGSLISREIGFFRCPALAAVEQTVLTCVVLRLGGDCWYL